MPSNNLVVDSRIKEVLDHLEGNYKDFPDLKRISAIAHLSPYHFHRLFKKEVGVPLRRFIELLKLENAYHALQKGDVNVRDLALSLGYNDYETFSRAFKKQYEISPDIFKSIGIKVLEQVGAQGGKVQLFIINTDDLDTNEEISEKMLQKLVVEKFQLQDAHMIKTFMLEPTQKGAKKAGKVNKDNSIKNRYELKEENKIYEKVLQKLKK